MSEITVRIVQLEPLHVASVQGFGAGPETLAHEKLAAWAGPRGYLDDLAHHRVFGFNNPNPTPASPNYGYELWITVGPEVQPEEGVRILDFPGGLYAVAHMKSVNDPGEEIPATWAELVKWVEDSPYRPARHQWLEEHLRIPGGPADDWALDLYMPISR
jgi:AraC family transcriptional regulator